MQDLPLGNYVAIRWFGDAAVGFRGHSSQLSGILMIHRGSGRWRTATRVVL